MVTKWPDKGVKGMVTLGSTRPRAVWGGCSERLQSSSWQPRWDHDVMFTYVRATRQRAVCGGCSKRVGTCEREAVDQLVDDWSPPYYSGAR